MMTIDQQTTPDQSAPRRWGLTADEWAAIGGALLYLGFFVAMAFFNAKPHALPREAFLLISLTSTVGYIFVLLFAIRQICRLQLSTRMETVLLFVTLLLFLVLNPTVREMAGKLLEGKSWEDAIGAVPAESHIALDILVPFLLILTGIFFGQIIARLIRERAIMVPVAIIAGLIDFWGVYWGPVHIMSDKAPTMVNNIATATTTAAPVPEAMKAQLPEALQFVANIVPPQNIGIGDFVFLAFFFTCAYRLGFSARRTMWGMFWGLLIACTIFALNGQEFFGYRFRVDYLPGLVFICGGVLLANLRDWKLTREEWKITLIPVGLLSAVIAGFVIHATLQQPHVSYQQYTLTATAPGDVLKRGTDRVATSEGVPPKLIPVFGELILTADNDSYRLQRWRLTLLGTNPERFTLRTSFQYSIAGLPDAEQANTWHLNVKRSSPPDDLLLMLNALKDDPAQQLTALRTIKPVAAAETYALLNDIPSLLPPPQADAMFVVRFFGDTVIVINQRGEIVFRANHAKPDAKELTPPPTAR